MFYESSKIVGYLNRLLAENQALSFKAQPELRQINGKGFRQAILTLNLSEVPSFFSKQGAQILYHADIIKALLIGPLDTDALTALIIQAQEPSVETEAVISNDGDDQQGPFKDQGDLSGIEVSHMVNAQSRDHHTSTQDHLRVFHPNRKAQQNPHAKQLEDQNTPYPMDHVKPSINDQGLSPKLLRQIPTFSVQDQKFTLELPAGYLLLSKDDALDMIQQGKTIERSGMIHLDLTGEFDKNINFLFVHIKKLVIYRAQIHKQISLVNCQIDSLHIKEGRFEQSFSLKGSQIKNISIEASEFQHSFNAERVHIDSKFVFNRVIFRQKVKFWEAVFNDWINWNHCEFHAEVDMRSTFGEAGFCMKESKFWADVRFRGMHLAMKWEAPQCTFEKLIDFSKAKLHDFVYLEDIIQGKDQRWAFMNTISERILIRPAQVEGRLLSEEEGNYAQAMREYGILKKAFEHEHRYDDDDWAFYRFKVNERRAESSTRSFWEKPFGVIKDFLDWLFLDWGCGYGTSPMRAVRSALLLILLFALFYTCFFHKVHPIDNLPFPSHAKDHFLNQFGISVLLSVSAFTSGFGDLKESVADWLNIPLMLEALLGTLMWGLFIVAFGRKVIR